MIPVRIEFGVHFATAAGFRVDALAMGTALLVTDE
jgi:hypothetical protein